MIGLIIYPKIHPNKIATKLIIRFLTEIIINISKVDFPDSVITPYSLYLSSNNMSLQIS